MTVDLHRRLVARKDVPSRILPCGLCAAPIPHTLVEPPSLAKLTFRSTTIAGDVWIPMKHSGGVFCRDPEPETAAFWDDDVKRENYKRERREASARAITWEKR